MNCENKGDNHVSFLKALFHQDPRWHRVPVVGMNQVRKLSCSAHRDQVLRVTSEGSCEKRHFLESGLVVVDYRVIQPLAGCLVETFSHEVAEYGARDCLTGSEVTGRRSVGVGSTP